MKAKKEKISHQDVMKRICDDIGMKSNSKRCKEMKKHLEACPDCMAYFDSVKKTIALYKLYPAPKVSKTTRKKLFAVIPLR